MTDNVFTECPICGAITRIRAPAGYVYSTPVRVHCGKCDTLLTGEFISDNSKGNAYFKMKNCKVVNIQRYDYYSEASGEMLCNKTEISELKDDVTDPHEIMMPPKPSPVFKFMDGLTMENRARYINFECYSFERRKDWDQQRIKYDLFLNQKNDLIKQKFTLNAKKVNLELSSEWDVLRYIFVSYFYDVGGIFTKSQILARLKDINYTINHMDRYHLKEYLEVLDTEDRLSAVWNKLLGIMFSFTDILPFLMPAIGATQYKENVKVDYEHEGLSTCSFSDIKNFYIDAYEDLVGCSDLIVALDNILNRHDCDKFDNNLTLKKYREQKKGNRVQFLQTGEYFSQQFNLPVKSGALRNAIGHNDYRYNGAKQEIRYAPKTGEPDSCLTNLLEVATECCYLMQSSYILAFVVYELYRLKHRTADESMPMYPSMYLHVKSQSYCPCGSRRKYRQCCKNYISQLDIKKYDLEYPDVSEVGMTIPDGKQMSLEDIQKLMAQLK